MYEMLLFISGTIFILLGLFMVIFPAQFLKKESKDLQDKLKKARIGGIIFATIGIIMGIALIILGVISK